MVAGGGGGKAVGQGAPQDVDLVLQDADLLLHLGERLCRRLDQVHILVPLVLDHLVLR